jgi:hypothetical protein
MLTFIRESTTRTHTFVQESFSQKVCFLVVMTLFFKIHSVERCVYVMSSAASLSDNNGGRDHIIGFRISSGQRTAYSQFNTHSSRSRSDDRNQCNMHKKDSNFLLYENHSIMYNWTWVRVRWDAIH